jgi:hypothetical protein
MGHNVERRSKMGEDHADKERQRKRRFRTIAVPRVISGARRMLLSERRRTGERKDKRQKRARKGWKTELSKGKGDRGFQIRGTLRDHSFQIKPFSVMFSPFQISVGVVSQCPRPECTSRYLPLPVLGSHVSELT